MVEGAFCACRSHCLLVFGLRRSTGNAPVKRRGNETSRKTASGQPAALIRITAAVTRIGAPGYATSRRDPKPSCFTQSCRHSFDCADVERPRKLRNHGHHLKKTAQRVKTLTRRRGVFGCKKPNGSIRTSRNPVRSSNRCNGQRKNAVSSGESPNFRFTQETFF
jgi:hypothetical protein